MNMDFAAILSSPSVFWVAVVLAALTGVALIVRSAGLLAPTKPNPANADVTPPPPPPSVLPTLVLVALDGREDITIPATLLERPFGFSVGRMADVVDHVIPDEKVSRRHSRIRMADGAAFVEDLNSNNGTFLDEEQLRPFQLTKIREGAVLRLSRHSYRVRVEL